MRWLESWSLRWRAQVAILATGVPAVAVGAAALLVLDHAAFQARLTREVETTTRMVARTVAPALSNADRPGAARTLATLAERPEIRRAVLFDAQDRAFASHGEGPGTAVTGAGAARDTTFVHGGAVHVIQTIRGDRDRSGALYVQASLAELDRRATRGIVAIGIVLAAVLGLFAAGRLGRAETRGAPARGDRDLSAEGAGAGASSDRTAHGTHDGGTPIDDPGARLGPPVETDAGSSRDRERLAILVEERTKALHAAKESAERASQAKSERLASMSHELRTPLHAILSFSELGQRRATGHGDPKLAEYCERIHTSGTRLLQLIDALVGLAKLEAGSHDYHFDTHRVDEAVEAVVRSLSSECEQRGLALVFSEREPVAVRMDRDAIRQAVRHLLEASLRTTPDGGEVAVAVRRAEEGAVIAVWDSGSADPRDGATTGFEQTTRSSPTPARAEMGALGLAISREIVLGHGGRLWSEKRSDGRRQRCVELPARPPEERGMSTGRSAAA